MKSSPSLCLSPFIHIYKFLASALAPFQWLYSMCYVCECLQTAIPATSLGDGGESPTADSSYAIWKGPTSMITFILNHQRAPLPYPHYIVPAPSVYRCGLALLISLLLSSLRYMCVSRSCSKANPKPIYVTVPALIYPHLIILSLCNVKRNMNLILCPWMPHGETHFWVQQLHMKRWIYCRPLFAINRTITYRTYYYCMTASEK